MEDRLIELFTRQVSGHLSEAERTELEGLLQSSAEAKSHYEELMHQWESAGRLKVSPDPATGQSWNRLSKRLHIQKPFFLRPYVMRIAAMLLIAAGIGFYMVTSAPDQVSYATGPQEKIEISLPDGTKVTLNENSRLAYLEDYNLDKRNVEFAGEAFFDVVREVEKPFVIQSEHTSVEVLGTSFNVDAYPEADYVAVSVNSGQVSFNENKSGSKVILEKGMLGTFDKISGTIASTSPESINTDFWRTGNLIFENTPLEHVIKDLQKHFDTTVIIDKAAIGSCRFTGSFQNPELKDVLEIVAITMNLKLEPVASGYKFSGEGCDQFN